MKLLCPVCEGSYLLEALVKKLKKKIYYCEECSAVWKTEMSPKQENSDFFSSFMKKNNLEDHYSELEFDINEHPLICDFVLNSTKYRTGKISLVVFCKNVANISSLIKGITPKEIDFGLKNFHRQIDDIRCTVPPENYRAEVEKAYAEFIAGLPENIRNRFVEN